MYLGNRKGPDPKPAPREKKKPSGPKRTRIKKKVFKMDTARRWGRDNHQHVWAQSNNVPVGRIALEPCECGCGSRGGDIHHIIPRGMGGDPQRKLDTPWNLMNLNRFCHTQMEHWDPAEVYRIHREYYELSTGKSTDHWPKNISDWAHEVRK